MTPLRCVACVPTPPIPAAVPVSAGRLPRPSPPAPAGARGPSYGRNLMSAQVKLSARLPGEEEINGLDALVEEFVAFGGPVCAVVWLDVDKVTTTRDGTRVPTVAVARIEPIGVLSDVPQEVVTMVAKLYEARVGRSALPFDVTENVVVIGDDQ